MTTDRQDPQAASDAAEPETEEQDTEGQMMLPDATGRWLARDRERDIRQHLSGRQMKEAAKEARKRK
jgi:hypothetical protein